MAQVDWKKKLFFRRTFENIFDILAIGLDWILLTSCTSLSSGLFSSPRILFLASAYSCSLWKKRENYKQIKKAVFFWIITCFRDLIGCFGFSPFKSGQSPPPWEFLEGLLRIFTVGLGGTYWERKASSPKIIILVPELWLLESLKNKKRSK